MITRRTPLRRTPVRRSKARTAKRRAEIKVIAAVRARVADRDYYCRLYWQDTETRTAIAAVFGACGGPSEWAHWGPWRRSKTRGQDPHERHTTRGSLMLCAVHHRTGPSAYDAGGMTITALYERRGCNGRLRFKRGDAVWTEPT